MSYRVSAQKILPKIRGGRGRKLWRMKRHAWRSEGHLVYITISWEGWFFLFFLYSEKMHQHVMPPVLHLKQLIKLRIIPLFKQGLKWSANPQYLQIKATQARKEFFFSCDKSPIQRDEMQPSITTTESPTEKATPHEVCVSCTSNVTITENHCLIETLCISRYVRTEIKFKIMVQLGVIVRSNWSDEKTWSVTLKNFFKKTKELFKFLKNF